MLLHSRIISFCFIATLLPLSRGQSRVAWIRKNGLDQSATPFETVLSKLFSLTDNLYGIDNAVDTIDYEERVKVREDFDAVANKANEFLEQMISFLDGNSDEQRRSKGGFKGEFGKGRSTYDKGSLTLGQHVCVREKKVPVMQDVSGSSGAVCTLYKRATRCVTADVNGTLIRIVECCGGYQTEDIKKGCTSYKTPTSLDELLAGRNVCTNALELKDTKSTTLLIPKNEESCTDDANDRDWDEYILEQPYRSYELLNSQKLPTRKPDTFVIVTANPKQTDSSNDKPFLNCVKIVDEDLSWKNGIVQLLSSPLTTSALTLLDIITNSTDFTAFSELLTDELRERLAAKDRISTVFVFNDTTFASLSPSLRARMRQRKGCARDLINEHIYDGMICSAMMEDDIKSITGLKHRFYKLRVANDTELLIRLDNGRISDTDRVAANGVIHLIDDVIFSEEFVDWRDHLDLPERDFLDIVERNIGYEDEPVAIFVPPSDSFQNLTDEKSFVLSHIAMGDSHITNKLIKTAYGSKIPSSINSPKPTFGCAKTVKPAMKYCNTTIYFIDSPLPVIDNTLGELITGRDEFSMFASLLNDSTIDLENDGPYTVLLPSNDALSKNQIRALKANKTLANNFVRRHVFEGLLCSKNLRAKSSRIPVVLQNMKGEYYDGKKESEKTTIGDVELQEMDVLAVNGILHTVENPLQWHSQNTAYAVCIVRESVMHKACALQYDSALSATAVENQKRPLVIVPQVIPWGNLPGHFRGMSQWELVGQTGTDQEAIEFAAMVGLIANSGQCRRCGVRMALWRIARRDGLRWVCAGMAGNRAVGRRGRRRRRYCSTLSVRHNSVFKGHRLSIRLIVDVMYYWAENLPLSFICSQAHISKEISVDWAIYIREITKCSSKPINSPSGPEYGGRNRRIRLFQTDFQRMDVLNGASFGMHTNTIEGLWAHAKKKYRQMNFESYIYEFVFRRLYHGDVFAAIVTWAQIVYSP